MNVHVETLGGICRRSGQVGPLRLAEQIVREGFAWSRNVKQSWQRCGDDQASNRRNSAIIQTTQARKAVKGRLASLSLPAVTECLGGGTSIHGRCYRQYHTDRRLRGARQQRSVSYRERSPTRF